MRLFAKRVSDPEVCFCQNVLEILDGLSRVTTNVAWIAIARRVLNERGLMYIIDKHGENIAGYIVEECYPSDRRELMNHAEALFEIATTGVDWRTDSEVLTALRRVISKMGLYDAEKRELLYKYLYGGEKSELSKMIVDRMVNIF